MRVEMRLRFSRQYFELFFVSNRLEMIIQRPTLTCEVPWSETPSLNTGIGPKKSAEEQSRSKKPARTTCQRHRLRVVSDCPTTLRASLHRLFETFNPNWLHEPGLPIGSNDYLAFGLRNQTHLPAIPCPLPIATKMTPILNF